MIFSLAAIIVSAWTICIQQESTNAATVNRNQMFSASSLRQNGPGKRNFDTLELDKLLNDPMFMEFEHDINKQQGEHTNPDFLDSSAIDDMFQGNDLEFDPLADAMPFEGLNHHENVASQSFNGISNGPEKNNNFFRQSVKEKDPMSNVIPGAHGPFDLLPPTFGNQNHMYPFASLNFPAHAQNYANGLMDEFIQFLSLKESGMLDRCIGLVNRLK
ncbi:uncharacterized protein LOC127874822 [Dreissena polymorpha]|uniref:Uncharacterized protein n=1 Tax=Dreissena polymorpha TaxID=45954 RepID=A0A9D4LGV7_DREPO|nr:uncharacterized protein LOC127874822 [Dreissena polymorpha]KAH3857785.1 hypothetical protein DPMN_100400 [Dreissena polymorpha]